MRVLYLCPTFSYGDPARGLSGYDLFNMGEGIASHPAVSEVCHFDYYGLAQQYGRAEMTDALVSLAAHFDLVWHNTWHEELDDALPRIRTTTVGWGWDDDWRGEYAARQAPLHDFWLTTSRTFDAPNVVRTQYAVHPDTYPPYMGERDIDISFIGQPHGRRREVIAELRDAGLSVECFGYGWPGGEIPHEAMVEVMGRSKLCLNLSNTSDTSTSQIKGRVFEVPACRSVLLTDDAPGLDDYYTDGEECVVYRDTADLIDKARYWLSHDAEREHIAENGYRRTLAEHTWRHRMDDILGAMA